MTLKCSWVSSHCVLKLHHVYAAWAYHRPCPPLSCNTDAPPTPPCCFIWLYEESGAIVTLQRTKARNQGLKSEFGPWLSYTTSAVPKECTPRSVQENSSTWRFYSYFRDPAPNRACPGHRGNCDTLVLLHPPLCPGAPLPSRALN
jgi:hypothetical protein